MDRIQIENILEKSSNNKDEETSNLVLLIEKVLPDIEQHLKNIRTTLPNFDVHDESHSKSVLENMLRLSNYYEEEHYLTNFEYTLIILSAFLHDSGMALPEWELNLFKATEGNTLFLRNKQDSLIINNDGKKVFSFSEAREFIKQNKEEIYGDFNRIKDFIFIEETEDIFIKSISNKLITYQKFRNGFVSELDSLKNNQDYKLKSEEIRYEFIRQNHHVFSKKNCELLVPKFRNYCDDFNAQKLSSDLAQIVLGHGINFSEVENYELKSRYSKGNYANVFFITILLRLSDIIHFTTERAPKSLMSSMMLENPTSRLHWEVKQEEITSWLTDKNEKGQREVSYSAYFTKPNFYYFFQEYLDWIDEEISNYNVFLSILKKNQNLKNTFEVYTLNLAEKVNRNAVLYDKEQFEPVRNLKFVLNQNKILELLMGVGLYKDKYLCLRELYQNSLDACKCALASGAINRGEIKFGIDYDEKGKYLYCIDNGLGMNKEIIEKYFLNIGTSYYQSRDFFEQKANWNDKISPTSQFGIGILSCFMLGNEIEVVTKRINTEEKSLIAFKIDGPHEQFYYKNAEEQDIENIGGNGTLIKVYLSDEGINNENIENFDEELFFRNVNEETIFRNNIYFKIFEMVNSIQSNIDVAVILSDGTQKNIFDNFTPLNLGKTSEDMIIEKTKTNFRDEYKTKLLALKANWNHFDLDFVEVNSENIEIKMPIIFPTNNEMTVLNGLDSYPFLKRGGIVSIDGIVINKFNKISENIEKILYDKIKYNQPFLINFIGEDRPSLSVDRLEITDISEELILELTELIKSLKIKFIEAITEYVSKSKNSLLNEKVIDNCSVFHLDVIESLAKSGNNIPDELFPNLVNYVDDIKNIKDFFYSGTFRIKNGFLFTDCNMQEWSVYLSKLLDAEKIELFDSHIQVTCENELTINQELAIGVHSRRTVPFILPVENWDTFYRDFDIVTSVFPLVSPSLFKKIKEVNYNEEKNRISSNKKIYWIRRSESGITGIGGLQSVQLIPHVGFGSLPRNIWGRRTKSRILNYRNVISNYNLFELNKSGKSIREDNTDYVLRVFISTPELSDEETEKLELIKDGNSEYYKGVYEGWSVLFLGKSCEISFLKGEHNFEKLVKEIPKTFQNDNGIQYELVTAVKINV